MDKVIKVNGVFTFKPDEAKVSVKNAKARHSSDLALLEAKPSEADLQAILKRVLERLSALE